MKPALRARSRALVACAACVAALALGAGAGHALAQQVDRARLEARIAAVSVLIEKSTAAQQIDKSGDPRAVEKRAKAREVHQQAQRAFESGDLERASRLLPEASALMFDAVRLAAPEQIIADKSRTDFEGRMESVRSLLAAQRRITAEKPGVPGAREAAATVDQLMSEARTLANAERLADARSRLDRAYFIAKASIASLRGGDTLVRTLQFANKEEEFRYELDRNDTHKMLVQMLAAEKRGDPQVDATVTRRVDSAARLRAQADEASARGDYAAAVRLLEESTAELVKAIRGAGVFIPG